MSLKSRPLAQWRSDNDQMQAGTAWLSCQVCGSAENLTRVVCRRWPASTVGATYYARCPEHADAMTAMS